MDRHHQSPDIDPCELLNGQYEAVSMRDDYRRDLQIKSRNIIAARHRVSVFRWALSALCVAALTTLFILAWHMLQLSMGTPQKSPQFHRSANAPGHTQRPRLSVEKKIAGNQPAGSQPARQANPASKLDHSVHIQIAFQPPKITIASRQSTKPVVALVFVQRPVLDGAGRALSAGDKLPAGAVIRTGRGGRVTLVTRGGSELCLDSGSELALTTSSIAKLSRGRLYCSNRLHEIDQIITHAGRIRLLGTIVDTAVLSRNKVVVTVVEGKVRLSNSHGEALVNAGKKSMLMALNPPEPGVPVNAYKETAWYHGRGEVQSDYGDIAFTVARIPDMLSEVWAMNAGGSGKHRVASYLGQVELGAWVPGERWLNVINKSLGWTTPDPANHTAAKSWRGIPILSDQNWILDIATGRNMLADPLPEGYTIYADGQFKYVSPDQTRMVFLGCYRKDKSSAPEEGVYLYDRTTGNISRLLNGHFWNPPAWAPDSRRIVISANPDDDTANYKLVIIDTDTGKIRDLHINGAGASFSPDGIKIAYCGEFEEANYWYGGVAGTGGIFVTDLQSGSKPVRVSPKGQWTIHPSWSPDGKRILYNTTKGQKAYIVNSDGTHIREVYSAESFIRATSWAPSGNAIYVTADSMAGDQVYTDLVAADGSGKTTKVFTTAKGGSLPPEYSRQTKAAFSAAQEAFYQYAMGRVHRFEGNLEKSRDSFRTAADKFAELVWAYPLSGLTSEQTLGYADTALKMSDMSDEKMLEESCRERMEALTMPLLFAIRDNRRVPSNMTELRDMMMSGRWEAGRPDGNRWSTGWLTSNDKERAKMLFECPGSGSISAESYEYFPSDSQTGPNAGDVVLRCPIHGTELVWSDLMHNVLHEPVTTDGKPGSECEIRNDYYGQDAYSIPYRFKNAGTQPLTIIYHVLRNVYEVRGKAELEPVGRIYEDQEFKIGPLDEGSIGRDIYGDSLNKSLSKDDTQHTSEDQLFCRAVAQYEAGLPITNWGYIIEGEPAMLLYSGRGEGSCGASGSRLRFNLIGLEKIKLYQLKPSGKFRVYGTVRVQQTGQTCTNGWIDKDGNIISTESIPGDSRTREQKAITALFEAAKQGDIGQAESAIDSGVDINTTDENGTAALHYAVMGDNIEMTKLLLDHGAKINMRENRKYPSGWYPLQLAIRNENQDMVKMLIARGADVNVQRTDGWFAIHTAGYHGQPDVISLMISRGARVNVLNAEKATPLYLAINQHKIAAAKVLLEHGADINAATKDGWTPLHMAAKDGLEDAVKLLLANKANVDARDNNGETPLYKAAYRGYANVVKMLIAKGAKNE